jgi:hypothetical protein
MQLLPEPQLHKALHDFVHKQNSTAIADAVEDILEDTQGLLSKNKVRAGQ